MTTLEDTELRNRVVKMLSGDYACNRVWGAWQVGTMTQEDFEPLEETERVDELMNLITLHTQRAELKARIRENKFWSNGLFNQDLSRPPFITITDFHTRIADIEAQLTNPTEAGEK